MLTLLTLLLPLTLLTLFEQLRTKKATMPIHDIVIELCGLLTRNCGVDGYPLDWEDNNDFETCIKASERGVVG